MGNAISDDARLPTACAGENKYRPVSGFNSLTLLRIELGEKRQLKELLQEVP